MTKDERATLLRARFEERCGWKKWTPGRVAKKTIKNAEPKTVPHRRWPDWCDTLIERDEPSMWVRLSHVDAGKTMGARRRNGPHPLTQISEIFEIARTASWRLTELPKHGPIVKKGRFSCKYTMEP